VLLERRTRTSQARAQPGTLVHFGKERATLSGHRLIPWTAIDAIPALAA
jgi:hypothetical protein